MGKLEMIKPDVELGIALNYLVATKSGVDWKMACSRMCMLKGSEVISQGDKTDFEYYKLVYSTPKFHYYLVDKNEEEDTMQVIGRAQVSERGEGQRDIQYVLIESEYRGMGYGTTFFSLLIDSIFSDATISKIFVEDKSQHGQTGKILTKLGYSECSGVAWSISRDEWTNKRSSFVKL